MSFRISKKKGKNTQRLTIDVIQSYLGIIASLNARGAWKYRRNEEWRFPGSRGRDDLTAKNPFGATTVKIAQQDR